MNFIVCIKQVPATTDVRIDDTTNTLKREGVESIVNPFDEYAVEEGIRLRERAGGKVTALTMGPPQAEMVLRETISRGVDSAVLLSDRAFAGADTLATSYTIATAIRKLGPRYGLLWTVKPASGKACTATSKEEYEKDEVPQEIYDLLDDADFYIKLGSGTTVAAEKVRFRNVE